jgi:hypothetical protein
VEELVNLLKEYGAWVELPSPVNSF